MSIFNYCFVRVSSVTVSLDLSPDGVTIVSETVDLCGLLVMFCSWFVCSNLS